MIVVDSSVWIANLRDLKRPSVAYLNEMADPADIIVGDIVLLEVLRGARDESHASRIEKAMRRFQIEPMLNAEIAVQASGHYRSLRRRGVTVAKTADLIIATFCIERGHALLHDDEDFAPFAAHLGLEVVGTDDPPHH